MGTRGAYGHPLSILRGVFQAAAVHGPGQWNQDQGLVTHAECCVTTVVVDTSGIRLRDLSERKRKKKKKKFGKKRKLNKNFKNKLI